ncbi:MAG: NADH:ubiquinone reductase (Na(+)-transporting) subunit C [Rikenellaceae bacterium]
MNKQSNTYIIGYSIVLVVVVAIVLSFTALTLKPIQQANVEVEKMSDILSSVGLYQAAEADKAADKATFVKAEYAKYIVESFLVNDKGEKQNADAAETFAVLNNLKAELAKPKDQITLPVFISKNNAGKTNYVFPVYGTGLWGPIWGYIALSDDLNTVDGVVFDHKSETPGLGAEIATPAFQGQFVNKTIFDNSTFVGIQVLKGAGSSKGNDHAVDAISGGTITSRAVQAMILDCLDIYKPFIENQKSK